MRRMIDSRTRWIVCLFLTIGSFVRPAWAEEHADAAQPKETLVLWLGSSSTKLLVHGVDEVVNSRGDVCLRSHYDGGYFRIDYISEWISDGKSEQVESAMEDVRRAIGRRKYDVIAFQLSYGIFANEKTERHAAKIADDMCRLIRDAGATPLIYEHWSDHPERMRAYCVEAANRHGGLVAFCGSSLLAVKDAKGKEYVFDRGHAGPNGNYLSACSVYAALTDRSPIELPATQVRSSGPVRGQPELKPGAIRVHDVPADEALSMQTTAWTVHRKHVKLLDRKDGKGTDDARKSAPPER